MIYTCSKHNYSGLGSPCPDCGTEDSSMTYEEIKKLYEDNCIHGAYKTRNPHLMTFEGFVAAMNMLEVKK